MHSAITHSCPLFTLIKSRDTRLLLRNPIKYYRLVHFDSCLIVYVGENISQQLINCVCPFQLIFSQSLCFIFCKSCCVTFSDLAFDDVTDTAVSEQCGWLRVKMHWSLLCIFHIWKHFYTLSFVALEEAHTLFVFCFFALAWLKQGLQTLNLTFQCFSSLVNQVQ